MACIRKRRNRLVIDFYDPQGKRRWKTLPKDITKKQAKEHLRAIEEQVLKGNYLPAKKTPLFSHVAKDWLEFKRPNLRETTWETIESHLRNHFNELDGLKINRISTTTMEKFITTRQTKGMNINTLRKILVTLNQIFTYSVRHKYIDHNPLHDAERPRDRGNAEESKTSILHPSQIKNFLENVTEPKYKILFMLAIFTGARQGELLGLKWSDVDWQNKQINIQRTYTKGRFFSPKTKTSNRKIDIGPAVTTELKKWKLACPKSKMDLIFPNEAGQPINYSNMVRRYFEPTLTAANVPRIRFHDLRHTYASLLIEQGENIKYIQSQLGHSSPTVTLNVYAHLMDKRNQESAHKLENTIFEKNGSKMVAETKKATDLSQ
jgi:integrase